MGNGYNYHCEKCGTNYGVSLGVGMLFPQVYQQAIQDVLDGEYGREWQEAARDIRHFAVDAELKLYCCDKCGCWDVDYDMSLYEPRDTGKLLRKRFGKWTAAGCDRVPYVTGWDLQQDYCLVKEWVHPCEKCGKPMSAVDVEAEDAPVLKCPECGSELSYTGLCMYWD